MHESYIRSREVIIVAAGAFQVLSWDENPYESGDGGRRLTEAVVGQRFEGDLEGEGQARWLMCYRPDGTAAFVGLQRVDGTLDGRRGALVFQTVGSFDGQVARWSAEVVEDSATGELDGLAGSGTFEAPMGSAASFTLDVRFP
jgi:hypothetical protein